MSDHIDETLQAYTQLLPGEKGQLLNKQARAWAVSNPAEAKKSIELEGKLLLSAAEKEQRQCVRAYILAYQALGLKTPTLSIDSLRAKLKSQTSTEIKYLLSKEIAPYIMKIDDAQKLAYGWSFVAPGTQALCNNCLRARLLIEDVVTSAIKDLYEVGKNKKESTRYKNYFGTYDADQCSTVTKNLMDVLFAVKDKKVWFYYRGKNINNNQNYSDWPYLVGELLGMTSEDNCGSSVTPAQRKLQGLKPHRNATQSDADLHVKIGAQLEDKDYKQVLHTLIHEVTHFVCGTRDVKMPAIADPNVQKLDALNQFKFFDMYAKKEGGFISKKDFEEAVSGQKNIIGRRDVWDSYGDKVCQILAEYYPKKAICNADNYAFYCMQFVN